MVLLSLFPPSAPLSLSFRIQFSFIIHMRWFPNHVGQSRDSFSLLNYPILHLAPGVDAFLFPSTFPRPFRWWLPTHIT